MCPFSPCSYLLFVVEYDCAGLLHHFEHHDATQVPPHGHGHVGKGRQLVHELQQLLCVAQKVSSREKKSNEKEGGTSMKRPCTD